MAKKKSIRDRSIFYMPSYVHRESTVGESPAWDSKCTIIPFDHHLTTFTYFRRSSWDWVWLELIEPLAGSSSVGETHFSHFQKNNTTGDGRKLWALTYPHRRRPFLPALLPFSSPQNPKPIFFCEENSLFDDWFSSILNCNHTGILFSHKNCKNS